MENIPYIEDLPAGTWATKDDLIAENIRQRQQVAELEAKLDASGGRGKTFIQYIARVQELKAQVTSLTEQRNQAVQAVIEQCMLVESCWVEGDIHKSLKNLCEYWYTAGLAGMAEEHQASQDQVAEACASLLDVMYVTENGSEAIRAGEWRKHMKD